MEENDWKVVTELSKSPLEILDSPMYRDMYDLKKTIDNRVKTYPRQESIDKAYDDVAVTSDDFLDSDIDRTRRIGEIVEMIDEYITMRGKLMDRFRMMNDTSIAEVMDDMRMYGKTYVIDEILSRIRDASDIFWGKKKSNK